MGVNYCIYYYHSITITFALCLLLDATDFLGFKWVYPPAVLDQLDGGPRFWYGFPFPYLVDAQYTSMARYSMPHIWLLNMLVSTLALAGAWCLLLPRLDFKGVWGRVALGFAGLVILAYAVFSFMFWQGGVLEFVWNADPYQDDDQVSVFDLRPHFGWLAGGDLNSVPELESEAMPEEMPEVTPKQVPEKPAHQKSTPASKNMPRPSN